MNIGKYILYGKFVNKANIFLFIKVTTFIVIVTNQIVAKMF